MVSGWMGDLCMPISGGLQGPRRKRPGPVRHSQGRLPMTDTRKDPVAGSASRRGFMRQALRNALGAGASVAGLASGGAMAAGLNAPDEDEIVLLMDPDGYLIDRDMMLAERETLATILSIHAAERP